VSVRAAGVPDPAKFLRPGVNSAVQAGNYLSVSVERIPASKARTGRGLLQRYTGVALAVVVLYRLVKASLIRRQSRHGNPPLVHAADAFFLHVETDAAPQHVGGMVVLAPNTAARPTVDEIRDLLRTEITNMPRLRQRPERASRWRRWRWAEVQPADIDFDWHISECVAPPTDASDDPACASLSQLVAEVAAERLPRDRPMWRMILVREIAPGQSGLLFLVHHCVADGLGTVVHALNILRPHFELPAACGFDTGRCRAALAAAVGIAQLAGDGKPAATLPPGSPDRQFATCMLDLDAVRAVAHRHDARVIDVVLSLLAIALGRTDPAFAAAVDHRLRVSVPVMVAPPGAGGIGNATAAVMIDVPLADMPSESLLAHVSADTAKLLTPTRFLGSRFVMTAVARSLPAPLQCWFARTVYGPRFLQAVVSNMPGPPVELSIAGIPLERVVPILPLAPGAPLALGALSWTGELGIGLATDPMFLNAPALAAAMRDALRELACPPQKGGRYGDAASAMSAAG
jgi:diacylglycerol O-acyltransferase / wax synthase